LALDYNNDVILKDLLLKIEFRPYSISVDKYSIMVYGLGISIEEGWIRADPGFISSFIHVFGKKRYVFVQKFCNTKSIIEVWYENQKISQYEDDMPLKVWQKTGTLAKYRGTQLFGLENQAIQTMLWQLQVLSCKPSQ